MQLTEIAGCRITGIAGFGGFATTYAATHGEWGDVAVKVLSTNWAQNADVVRRFEMECETLESAGLRAEGVSRHVPRYFAHGVASGAPYLVTEFCAGGSLEHRLAGLRQADRIPVLLWVVRSALPGLLYIHNELDVIHRDISPGNVLFRLHDDGDDDLLIADFGMLKQGALQSNLSHVMGTAGYAAPEVRELGVCDSRSDVYSLGVIAWEILTGGHADVTTEFTRKTMPPSVPDDVATLILDMVQRDREERPYVDDVGDALDAITSPKPMMPPSLTESFVTPVSAVEPAPRPRRGALIAAGVIAVGALAAISGVLLTSKTTFVTHEPSGRGVVVELTDEWVADPPTDESVFFTATNMDRAMALGLGSLGAADATSAIELVVGTLDDDVETITSELLENGNGSLRYRKADGAETQIFFAERSCGALMMTIEDPDGFSDDDLAHVAEVGSRFRTIDQPVLPDREVPAPDGFTTFSLNGVALAAPDSYYRIDSPNHCLFVIDDTPEHTRSISINYYAAAELDAVVEQLKGVFGDQQLELLDESTSDDGFPRLHVANGVSEYVVFFVSDGAGVYTVQASEFLDLPYEEADLLTFDEVIGTFRVVT